MHKRFYDRNRERMIARTRERMAGHRVVLDVAKSQPCADCGVSYPPFVMDFDHREGEQKMKAVGLMTSMSLRAISEEIAKCDVVCSNCHRLRTFGRAQRKKEAVRLDAHDRMNGERPDEPTT